MTHLWREPSRLRDVAGIAFRADIAILEESGVPGSRMRDDDSVLAIDHVAQF